MSILGSSVQDRPMGESPTTKRTKALQRLSYDERLRKLELLSLEKAWREDLINTWREGAKKVEPGTF